MSYDYLLDNYSMSNSFIRPSNYEPNKNGSYLETDTRQPEIDKTPENAPTSLVNTRKPTPGKISNIFKLLNTETNV